MRNGWGSCTFILLALLISLSPAAEEVESPPEVGPITYEILAPVTPCDIDVDLRDLPQVEPWMPGDPIKDIPRRYYPPPGGESFEPAPRGYGLDPLVEEQWNAKLQSSRVFTTPVLNFAGPGFTGVYPPDTVGDVGPNHYIQMVNHTDGSLVSVYDKSGGLITSFLLDSLCAADHFCSSSNCTSGHGDPIVLYDRFANRWLLSEFSNVSDLCVYISKTGNPVSGGWYVYALPMPNFPDYPKWAIWPTDSGTGLGTYIVTTNEGGFPTTRCYTRGNMLYGFPTMGALFLTEAPLPGFGFQGILAPADVDGPNQPPGGAPLMYAYMVDDESHYPASNDPTQDFIRIWELDLAWPGPVVTIPPGASL